MLTKDELQNLLDYWQPVLRLADWDIEATVVSGKKIQGCEGDCYAWPDLKEAKIRVARGNPIPPSDHELVLVHELLHCHLEPLRNNRTEATVEAIVEALSKAFVNLARGG